MACHCVKPKTIFEMGTFSGYSTYEFARREKPLHSLCSGQPLFGSEIKSLLTMSPDLREIDPYDDSLILGSTPIGDTGTHNRTSMLGRIGRPSRRSGANAPDQRCALFKRRCGFFHSCGLDVEILLDTSTRTLTNLSMRAL